MGGPHDIVIPQGTSWLADPAARAVCAAFDRAGFDIYFVGGCVRNALLGLPDSDVDMATNALPEQTTRIAKDAGLKAIPTGIDHGTVTVVADGVSFEVTTFRRDVETDGRRAVVSFSDRIEDDARRRDFTMNALYARPDGTVLDPVQGLGDLLARRIRFIHDPAARIREDYLRILRFFRFSAWYADPSFGFEPETLAAISENLDGLETLSVERIGHEMVRLLAAPEPAGAVAAMRQVGVLPRILPGSDDRLLGPLVHIEATIGTAPDRVLRLAAIGGEDVPQRLRLSRSDARYYNLLREEGFSGPPLPELAYRHGAKTGIAAMMLRAALAETLPDPDMPRQLHEASIQRFPVQAQDLMPALQGPDLGEALRRLEARWIASAFALTKTDLLKSV